MSIAHARAPVQIGHDAAHHVVRRGRDGDRLARRIQARVLQRRDDVGKERGVDAAHVEADRCGARALQQRRDRPRDLVARRELLDEALAVGPVQRRALAADRLRDEKALTAGDPGHGGGMELEELEVGEIGPRGVEAHPHALEVMHAARRLAHENLRRRAAHEVAPRGLRVGEVAVSYTHLTLPTTPYV